MTPEKWQQVKAILEDAVELEASARPAYLESACNGDDDLRAEVVSFLDQNNTYAERLDGDVLSSFVGDVGLDAPDASIGKQIGNYRILSELGAGGMGSVFLAERSDGTFEQKVAVKLIKRGMDSDAILKRFINERQILASLEHPNIARLIDGGAVDGGMPYFVMEYVDGQAITEFASSAGLGLREKLHLFRKVCSAVSYAHQNLVIHRDLKPSNILVTKDGSPKLLDFGIAKLLKSDDVEHTATQHFIFTPEYASPEQVRSESLTTASDVYSLGVILYEMLAGQRPYKTESRSIGEMVSAICESEPARPSSVAGRRTRTGHSSPEATAQQRTDPQSLRGDLDTIVLKALRKEPDRRYSSVDQLSDDIGRHLDGLPVLAIKDTWRYRASKFVRRNRIGVAAAAMIVLTLLTGLGATLYQTSVARSERAKAEQRFNDVRRLVNSFMFEIDEQMTQSPIKARELLVVRGLEYLDKLAAEAASDIELQSELAAAYEKIGDVQGEIFRPNLGRSSEALSSHQKALELRERLFAAEPGADRGVAVATSYLRIGNILMMNGDIAGTRENYRRAIDVLEPLLIGDEKHFLVRRRLASSFASLGQATLRSGSLNDALASYERSLALFQELYTERPDDVGLERGVGIVYSYIGFVKMETARTDEAVECYGKWLEIEQNIAARNNDPAGLGHLSTAHIWHGIAQSSNGNAADAIAHLMKGVEIQENTVKTDKDNFTGLMSLADAYLELGKIQTKYGQPDAAVRSLEKAIVHYQAIWRQDPQSLFTKQRVTAAQRHLAGAFRKRGDRAKALENYKHALTSIEELTAADANNSDWQLDLAMSHVGLGEYYLTARDRSAALTHFQRSLPILERLSAASPENTVRKRDLETVRQHLAQLG